MIKIIVPTYNSEKTIRRTIDSILNQTYKNFIVVIVDDCSTDNTLDIIKTYDDLRVRYLTNEKNSGVSFSRNKAIDFNIFKFDYIAYCDSDDWWEPSHLQECLNYLKNADIVYSNPKFLDINLNNVFPTFPIYDKFDVKNFIKGNFIWISSVVHKVGLGKFDSNVDSLEDYDMWLQAVRKGWTFVQKPSQTVFYFVRPDGMASKSILIYETFKNKNIDFFVKPKTKEELKAQYPIVYNEVFTWNSYACNPEDIKDKILVDIGANRGFFSILAEEYGVKRIYAYEANPKIFEILKDNVRGYNNIEIFNTAVMDEDNLSLFISNDDGGSFINNEQKGFPVTTVSLDTIVKNLPEGEAILKMDVEGAEYDILKNKPEALNRFSTIYIEIHSHYNSQTKDIQIIMDILKQFGFKRETHKNVMTWDVLPDGTQTNLKDSGTVIEKWSKNPKIKLNVGCGDEILEGYINIDAYSNNPNVEKYDVKKLPYADNTVDEIFASHIIEHFKFKEAFDVLREWRRVLKPGGKLILETPDFLETCKEFVNADEQWRIRLYGHFFAWPDLSPGQVHYFLYTETQLRWTLNECGYKNVIRVEPTSVYARSLPNKHNLFLKVEATK